MQTTLFLVWDGPGAFPTSLFMCIVRTYRIISTRDNAPEYVITYSLKSFNLFSASQLPDCWMREYNYLIRLGTGTLKKN